MKKLRNLKKVMIFVLTFLIVLIMIPNFLYAAWPDIVLSPTSASIGDALTITGTGFGAAIGSGKVTFAGSGDTITVTSWSDTVIVLNIPAGTVTGNVTVTESTGVSTSNPATLTIKPGITSLSPTSASIGDALTITGTGFGAAIGSGKVTFAGSGDTTTVTSWSDTVIVLNIPAGTVTGNVTVTESTGVATSDPETLTIIAAPPAVEEEVVEEETPEPDPWEITDIGYYEKTDSGFLTMLYSRFFSRLPDQTGFDSWLTWIRSGNVTGENLMSGFIFSEECQTRISGYTNSEFIMFLYEVFFDREPSQDNYDIWFSRMNAGMSREIVIMEFTHSEEFISLCNLFSIIPYAGYIGE